MRLLSLSGESGFACWRTRRQSLGSPVSRTGKRESSFQFKANFALIILALAFLLATTFSARTDIRIDHGKDLNIFITGTITARDAAAFQKITHELERRSFKVSLDSIGGDVRAAMQIGRLVRRYDGSTEVLLGGRCYSSCALVFVAGVFRLNAGEIGLHRPYLASAPQSRQSLEKHVPLMLSLAKRYISEMGITDNFYHQMVNTEPAQMVKYALSESDQLVPIYDPAYQEIEISYGARRYGITTAEMRQREKNAERCYKLRHFVQMGDCVEAARWGLTGHVYRERALKTAVCAGSKEEIEVIEALPKKERQDHALWIRAESCVRNIMLRP
jgi:hypothetical protein